MAVHLVTLAEAAFVRTTSAAGARDQPAERRLDIRSPVDGRVLRVLREDFGPIDGGAASGAGRAAAPLGGGGERGAEAAER
ncbi:MAG: hypothetical protein ACKOHK_03630, partial [Planctomycetia bacterium]